MGNVSYRKPSQNNLSEEELREFYKLNTRLDVNRSLFSIGHNSKGQLGLGEVSNCRNIARPFPVINPKGSGALNKPIKIVSCGAYYVMIVTVDNEIYACGENSYSQIGVPSKQCAYTCSLVPIELNFEFPKQVKVKDVKCGQAFTYIVIEYLGDQLLFGCGRNVDGQLSLPKQISIDHPQIVDGMLGKNIKFLECGYAHAVAVTTDNKIYTTGDNRYRQCGHSSPDNIFQFKELVLTNIENQKITAIACGYYHTVIVVNDRTVYAFGMNRCYQFGNNLEDGPHLCTEIFKAPQNQYIFKVASGPRYIITITSRGEIYYAGNGITSHNFERLTEVEKYINNKSAVTKISNIACGESHSVIVCEGRRVFVRGDNTYGQLGIDKPYTEIEELKLEQYGLMTSSKSTITCVDAGDYFTFFGVSNALHGHQMYSTLKKEDHPLCDVVIGFHC